MAGKPPDKAEQTVTYLSSTERGYACVYTIQNKIQQLKLEWSCVLSSFKIGLLLNGLEWDR